MKQEFNPADFVIHENVTLDTVKKKNASKIFYGARTCWWTVDPKDLYTNDAGLPVDPLGGVLFETENVRKFLLLAENNTKHYGKFGLRTFLAAYHGNCVVKESGLPTSFPEWRFYEAILEYQDKQREEQK